MVNMLRRKIDLALDGMNEAQLQQVLDGLNGARSRSDAASFGELLKEFGGSIPDSELDRIERAIEEDCGRIEAD